MTASTRRTLCVGLALVGLMGVAPVRAHRAKAALATIVWNERTGLLEVTHRLHAHDAQQALIDVAGSPRLGFDSVEARARLALYVEERFALTRSGGEPLPLHLVGAELEGDYVFVFQEAEVEEPPTDLEVRCVYLHDVFPGQINTVNGEFGGPVRTITFAAGDDAKPL